MKFKFWAKEEAIAPKKSLDQILGTFEEVKKDLVKFQVDNTEEIEDASLYIQSMEEEIRKARTEITTLTSQNNRTSNVYNKISELVK
jgi:tetrahydromethanopterin S-methyltransferase subunit H